MKQRYNESSFDPMTCTPAELNAATNAAKPGSHRRAFLEGIRIERAGLEDLEKSIENLPNSPARSFAEGIIHARTIIAAATGGARDPRKTY